MNLLPIPGGSRMERKKEETRQKILQVALELFRQQGFEGTKMEAIAETADIAKGTLYNYFPVKEAILDEYIRRSFQEQNAARLEQMQQLPDTRARMQQVFDDLLKDVRAQKAMFEKYVVYRMQQWVSFQQEDNEKSGFYLLAAEIVRLGQADGELRSDLPASMMGDLCEYAFMLAVKAFYLDPQGFDVCQTIADCVDVFMNGVKKYK